MKIILLRITCGFPSAAGFSILLASCLGSGGGGSSDGQQESTFPWSGTIQFGSAGKYTHCKSIGVGANNIAVTGTVTNINIVGSPRAFARQYDIYGNSPTETTIGFGSGVMSFGLSTSIDSTGLPVVAATTDRPSVSLTKFSSSGGINWSTEVDNGHSPSITMDTNDNVFMTGLTVGTLSFDGIARVGPRDFFISKFNSSGAKQWTILHGTASGRSDSTDIHVDSAGNILVSGFTEGSLDGSSLTGTHDMFVSKFDSAGSLIWTRQLGATASDSYAKSVASDSSGNIYVAGWAGNGFDGQVAIGHSDAFLTKFDSSGTKLWTKVFGVTSAHAQVNSVAIDSQNNVYIAGLVGGSLPGASLVGIVDYFVIKFDSSGTRSWTYQGGKSGASASAQDIYIHPVAGIMVTGSTSGGLDGNSLTGTEDCFIANLTTSGHKR